MDRHHGRQRRPLPDLLHLHDRRAIVVAQLDDDTNENDLGIGESGLEVGKLSTRSQRGPTDKRYHGSGEHGHNEKTHRDDPTTAGGAPIGQQVWSSAFPCLEQGAHSKPEVSFTA